MEATGVFASLRKESSPIERGCVQTGRHFVTDTIVINGQPLRVGRKIGNGVGTPLLIFNGIGACLELLEPLVGAMPDREIIAFDVPGVGGSKTPLWPYRFTDIASLSAGLLDYFGHKTSDVLGISWGGGAAQQFARNYPDRCRRLILCSTSPGVVMIPAHPKVWFKMATPLRYMSADYLQKIAGDIYGGDFRDDPGRAECIQGGIRMESVVGYALQLVAVAGWTSIHWLHLLEMPTLIMVGSDDPLVPIGNAVLMRKLIPNSDLQIFDCGHLFLLTRLEEATRAIDGFLD